MLPESGGYFVVPAGSKVSAEDEVLRTETDCPDPPAQRSAVPAERSADWEVICGSSVAFGWTAPTEVEFTVSKSSRILVQADQVHGVSIRVRRGD